MKCPMCGAEIAENASQCGYCKCNIVYNGTVGNGNASSLGAEAEVNGASKGIIENYKNFSSLDPAKKSVYVAVPLIIVGLIIIAAMALNSGSDNDSYVNDYQYTYYAGNNGSGGNDEVHDWMKDNAEGKDYDYDDGGSYYCMGKNDTCPNKVNNAYDLYCSSCDPDGDNVEG